MPRVSQNGADVVVRINRPLDLAVPEIAAAVMPSVATLMLYPAHGLDGTARRDRRPRLLRPGLRRGRALGFATAACIHPAHVPIINEEYGTSPAELDRARRLLAAFDTAVAAGDGAVSFEGSMIDLPVATRARRFLERAESWA